jgi:hypothetical protein
MSESSLDTPLITFLSTFLSPQLSAQLSTELSPPAQNSAFPARARLFCDQRLLGILPADLRGLGEWPGSGGSLLLAAACGAAVAEEPRGGRVVVVVPASALSDPALLVAAHMAVRLHVTTLTLAVVSTDPAIIAPLIELGWRRAGAGPVVLTFAPRDGASLPPTLKKRQEWQPVHLRTLLPGTLPPWPVDGASMPPAAASDWLAWLAIREPDLVVANLAAGWREQIPSPALLCALAQLAGEGRRVCWRVPTGTDVRPWLDAMQEIGRRGLALKLLVNANDLPPRPQLAPLTGWWILVPADTNEAAAMMAHALDSEDPVVIGLTPTIPVMLPPWPAKQAYHPGRGRWLKHGAAATLVCDQRTLSVTAAAAIVLGNEGVQLGVLLCTSVLPLPVGDLDHAGSGPLMACGNDLGIALASALTDRDVHVHIVGDVGSAEAIVTAVRKMIGATP